MRTIEFKALDMNGDWVRGDLIRKIFWIMGTKEPEKRELFYIRQPKTYIPIFVNNFPFTENECEEILVDENTVCEFTGYLDKNNIRIYENDIIEFDGQYTELASFSNSYLEADLKDVVGGVVVGNKFDKKTKPIKGN